MSKRITEIQFHKRAETFFSVLKNDLKNGGIELAPHWEIDHICYRTESDESYEELKTDLASFGKMLIESDVNGRLIATFELNTPLHFLDRRIDLVELPAPKKGKVTPEGFEHIEIVCDVPFSELKTKYAGAKFDEKGLTKDFNQELEVQLENSNIKFHLLSLKKVIELENQTELFHALKSSGLLKDLTPYKPLVAVTNPVKIFVQNYESKTVEHAGFKFEIYSGSEEPVRQAGYQEFLRKT